MFTLSSTRPTNNGALECRIGRKEGGSRSRSDRSSKQESERASDDPAAAGAARAVIQIDDNKFSVRFGRLPSFLRNQNVPDSKITATNRTAGGAEERRKRGSLFAHFAPMMRVVFATVDHLPCGPRPTLRRDQSGFCPEIWLLLRNLRAQLSRSSCLSVTSR